MPKSSSWPALIGPRLAISIVFFVTGMVAGTWFGRIPAVTSNLDLDTGQIGSLILFLGVGSLVAFQFIGQLVMRFGSARITLAFASLTAAALSLLALAPGTVTLGMALFSLGFTVGATGVAMNAQGISVQKHLGTSIMNSLHGCFTLGTLVGSAIGAVLAHLDVSPLPHFLGCSVVALGLITAAARNLVADEPAPETENSREGLTLPPRELWPLGMLALCAGLAEGSMYDWSALFVHEELGASEGTGALAFAAFSLAMLVGRFAGDRIVERLGVTNVIRTGGTLAAVGLWAGLLGNTVPAAFGGFILLGLGLSVLMPLFYSAAGTHPGIPSVRGVAAIATMGFLGLLSGPPLLGTIADFSSLRLALGVVVALCGIMAWLAGYVKTSPAPSILEPVTVAGA